MMKGIIMSKLLLIILAIASATACTHGSFASKKDLDSARFATRDLCCGITMQQINENKYKAFGCGQEATYVLDNGAWRRDGPIRAGVGDPANKLKNCNQ
jgi:hypothetical protein